MEETNVRIKRRRLELGLTADEVAAAIGVSRATLYRYEAGDIAKIPSCLVEKLSHVLDTTPAHLLGIEDESRNFDDFVYAMHHESRYLTAQEKAHLLLMARFMRAEREKKEKKRKKR